MKLLSLLIVCFGLPLNAFADVSDFLNEPTQVTIEIPAWVYGVEAEILEGGVTANVDTSVSERVDRFRPSGELNLTIDKGKWFLLVKPQFAKILLDGEASTPYGSLPTDVTVKSQVLEFAIGRELIDRGWVVLDAYVGARNIVIEVESETVLGENNWENKIDDLVFGLIASFKINNHLSYNTEVNWAGWSLYDSSSEESLSLKTGIRYENNRFSVDAGWESFDIEYNDDANGVPQNISFELEGPVITFGWVFKKRH
ncbi:MAG: hypothetical protein R2827_00265 [Bdellovibrionales bacterium]